MRAVLIPALVIALVTAVGCGDRAPGFIITSDGRMMDNSAANDRAESMRTIDGDLQKHLGEHWRATTTIAETPIWSEERGEGEWRWQKATVTVALLGDGAAPLPITADEMRLGVIDYMRPKVEHAKVNLAVEVTQTVDAAAFALPTPDAVSSPTVKHPAPGAARTYTVQTGDTLADISSAFYGSPQHWRRIADANPGLDPGALQPGTVLTIPAAGAAP